MPKSPKIRYHREGIDPGLSGVKEWVARWYEEPADFSIREFSIECPTRDQLKVLCNSKAYRAASQRNELPLHSYLKFLAWAYLREAKTGRRQPAYEMQMYFPIPELLKGVRFVGNTFDPSRAQVIEKGRRDVFCSYGDAICVDVYVKGLSVEVGATQPYNLCMPLLERLVEKAIWIPFPPAVEKRQFNPMTCPLKSVNAYEFTPSPSSNFSGADRPSALHLINGRCGPAAQHDVKRLLLPFWRVID